MPMITINLPIKYVLDIQLLLDAGIYRSRSDFLRKAIMEFLLEETLNELDLNPTILEQNLKEKRLIQ